MRLLSLVLSLFPAVLWAADMPLSSRVVAVTLYPQGATVMREVAFSAPAGQHNLVFTDLPRSTPLESVRVEVSGTTMGGVAVRTDFVPPARDDQTAAIAAAEAEVKRLEAALRSEQADTRAIRLEAEAARARIAFLRELGKGDALSELGVDALRDLTGMIGDETLLALRAAHDAEQRIAARADSLTGLQDDLEAARQALKALVPRNDKRALLSVSVSAEAATEGTAIISYTIDDAGWLPVYDLRLQRSSGRLLIERGALVSQSTGENWQDVSLTLSTVRPSGQTRPGEIWPWQRRIFDPERIRTKDMVRAETGMDAFAGGQAAPAAQAPAIIEQAAASFDGLSVTYAYAPPVSVASGADRVRIALGTLEAEAEVAARAVPLNDSTAFLMADFRNGPDAVILPTPEAMFYLDGRFIGKSAVDLIPAGAEAGLSFGPVDGLRLTRTVLDRSAGDRGMISRSSQLSEEVRIEVENLTGETWPVTVLDRVPYSEQDALQIEWEATPAPDATDVDGKRGVMSWTFDLPAGQTRTIALDHSLKWPDGMALQ